MHLQNGQEDVEHDSPCSSSKTTDEDIEKVGNHLILTLIR